jgi:hypothetical protein
MVSAEPQLSYLFVDSRRNVLSWRVDGQTLLIFELHLRGKHCRESGKVEQCLKVRKRRDIGATS